MPKIIPYIIKSFRGGVSDENKRGIAGSFKFGRNLNIHGRDDVLKCASAMVTLDSTGFSDLPRFLVPARDGSVYAFGHLGSIYAISGNTADPVVTFVYNDENGAINGAAEWKQSNGVNYLYWATATSIARAALDGSGDTPWAAGMATQDYKTTLNNEDWHTMVNASGSLQIANGEYLAKIDFDGNFDPAALNIRPGNIVKALEERDDYVILGSERRDDSEEGHLWAWLVTAQNWVQKKRIPIKGINALITAETSILQGGSDGEIFPADFINSVPLATIPGGGEVMPGGVSISEDLAVLGNHGGSAISYPGIWSYGRRNKNRGNALNFSYLLAATNNGSQVTTIGGVAMVNGMLMVTRGVMDDSYSSYALEGVSSTTLANAIYEGLEFDGGAPHLKKLFDRVKITFSPLATGTSFSIKWKKDKQSTWQYAVFGDGATTFSKANETQTVASIGTSAHIFEIGAELNASGSDSPEIHSITTYLTEESSTYA